MRTQKIPIELAVPGMVVADDVYTFNNQLIIAAGTTLTDRVITHLNFYSVPSLLIRISNETPVPLTSAAIVQEVYSEKVKKSPEYKKFNKEFTEATAVFQGQLNGILTDESKHVDTDALLSEMYQIMKNARNGLHLFDMLHCMRNLDDLTYAHSINVALISNVLGKRLKFSRKDLETLTLCGLLHDIGKLETPPELLKKADQLTKDEHETIKLHTLKGYNILKKKDLNIHIQMTAMMHHERLDGSGYPMGIRTEQIDSMAKIVMIADVYDAMTSARAYRGAICPFEVLGVFESEGLSKFDPKCLIAFLDYIKETYLGNTVRLSDKSVGKIVMMDRNNITKPVIQLKDRFVDLTKDYNLYIEAIL